MQQGLRQASARTLSGWATETNYNEDFQRLFDAEGIAAGTFNERFLRWLNYRNARSDTVLTDAMARYAAAVGASSWSAVGTFGGFVNFLLSTPGALTYSRVGAATAPTLAGVVTSFVADAPQRTDVGLLLEAAATNIALRSQEVGTSPWTAASVTFTANAGVAPDGTTTADAVIAAAANAQHRTDQATTIAAAQHTLSVYLKAFGYNYAWIRIGSAGAYFDLTTGETSTVSAGITARSVQAANGFWRCIITVDTAVANSTIRINTFESIVGTPTFVGDGVSGLLAWGVQLETGAAATSYIPTVAATATRGLPVATVVVPAGMTAARANYRSGTSKVGGLTPGGTLNLVTGMPWLELGNELQSLEWLAV